MGRTDNLLKPKKGERFGGRKKGTPNKINALAKDVIASAAEQLGGVERLVAWVKESEINERIFWGSIYPKLLPLTAVLSGDPNNPIERLHRIELVVTKPPHIADADRPRLLAAN
jgi:hypothetical protein